AVKGSVEMPAPQVRVAQTPSRSTPAASVANPSQDPSAQIAQAAQAPANPPAPIMPAPAESGSGRLISLDFKDPDVVNLLRIIVIGDDVKGKMPISLRNVAWDLALDTILEARGLVKTERDNVIRVVSADQLAKEREAKARVEEAKLKAEADVRTKVAEAQLK